MSVYKREWKDKQGKTRSCWYFHKTINGVRYRERIPTARTKTQAEEAERAFIAQIHNGAYGRPKGNKTFKQFVEEVYLPWARQNKKSFKSDESRVKPIVAFFGKYSLSQITPFLIERYKGERRRSTTERKTPTGEPRIRSVGSVNRELQLLHRIFAMAVLKRDVATNPRAEVKMLKGENPRNRYLRPEEREKLFKAIGKRQYLLDVVELDLNTGLRKGELLNLKLQALDFYRELIHVSNTKSGRDRYIPMNATAKAILQRRVEEAQSKGYEYLFTNPRTGTRYNDVKRGFREALDEAGIEDFRFHDLRHTFGSMAVEGGAPLTALRDMLGHTSLETTNRYAHSTEEGRRRVVEAQEFGHKTVTKDIMAGKRRVV